METYVWIKLLHIIGGTVLFGTGAGTAFFMLRAYLSGNHEALTVTTSNVVLADWIFTSPAVVVQAATGLWLTLEIGIPFGSAWFLIVTGLFVVVGMCWLPVVWLQIKIRNILQKGGSRDDLRGLMSLWVALGIPAFASVLVLFGLMVVKPWTDQIIFQ